MTWLWHYAINPSVTKDEFKKLRQNAGHTQASLSEAMGVHLRTVWRWELGETVIPKVVELALRYVAEHAMRDRDAAELKQARASLKEIKKDLERKHRRQKH